MGVLPLQFLAARLIRLCNDVELNPGMHLVLTAIFIANKLQLLYLESNIVTIITAKILPIPGPGSGGSGGGGGGGNGRGGSAGKSKKVRFTLQNHS